MNAAPLARTTTLGLCALPLLLAMPIARSADTVYGRTQAERCYELATAHVASRDALHVCSEAVEEEELGKRDRAATYSNRGLIHAYRDDLEAALADQNHALAIDATSIQALINRANVLMRMDRYQQALEDYELAIFYSEERSSIAYYNRALTYRKLGRKADAEADLRRALELQPTSRRYRDALANLD